MQSNFHDGELDAELELAHDIGNDPNALEYFKDDTPMDNIIKRYRCQVELYLSILNLRQGRYYSTGYVENDGIAGFMRVINAYEWSFFDSPELFQVQDEGTVLRKLLAVFSCRPSFTSLSSFIHRTGLGHTAITDLARTSFINIPIINIRLPINLNGGPEQQISLKMALSQTDYIIEHRIVTPKSKSVIYSNQVAFFYANRRYPTVSFNTTSVSMRYLNLPMPFRNQITINKTNIVYAARIDIGKDWFNLRSVVLLQRPSLTGIDMSTGCSAAIIMDNANYLPHMQDRVGILHYNPSISSYKRFRNVNDTGYETLKPINCIDEIVTEGAQNEIGLRTEYSERGTVFFYVKENRQ